MPAPEITVEAHELDLSKLEFGDLKHYEKSKIPFVPVTYAGGRVLKVITPETALPFGVGVYVPEGKDESDGVKSVDLSFRNPSPEAEAFRKKMAELDSLVLETAFARSKQWFGKQKTKETVEDNYNLIVKTPKNPEYGQSMKVKWPKLDEPTFWDAQQEDEDGNPAQTDEEACVSNSRGSVKMTLRPLWMVQGKFGLKWELQQLLLTDRPAQEKGCHWKRRKVEAADDEE